MPEYIYRAVTSKGQIFRNRVEDINKNTLIKVKNNKVQSTLNQKERLENTKNVYKLINLEKINNKRVLIFDDIYTTGATINACIEEVKKANPEKTGVLTLAKD